MIAFKHQLSDRPLSHRTIADTLPPSGNRFSQVGANPMAVRPALVLDVQFMNSTDEKKPGL